jgi:CubicO group peptidase (beta-lactamase class C family)
VSARLKNILISHRVLGATVALFDYQGVSSVYSFGVIRRKGAVPAAADSVYRIASVTKMVVAACVMRLAQAGIFNLDADACVLLPFLRHPAAPEAPVTLRMLLSHTAGIHDGQAYSAGLRENLPLSAVFAGDSHTVHVPGEKWEYSNLGAGIIGSIIETVTGKPLDTVLRETIFEPLGIKASVYPQRIDGQLADARRVLPPWGKTGFDALERSARKQPGDFPDAEHHYALAHGNLCISAPALARIGSLLMTDEFSVMRAPLAPFGARANNLSQGMGIFILSDAGIGKRPLYGHQGAAYGAIHGLFFDPALGRGIVLLTSGADEARRGVLADVNRDILIWAFGSGHGTGK